ncbi:MAG: sigma-54 dependent transcriptional regulator [bacterium]|nr:sigma-54 dependent transcriptional regulator [bacterium]
MVKDDRCVLIVDDEKDIRVVLSHLMEREGLRPMVAESGEEALGIVRRQPPDVLLVDVKMSGMDGMEVMRRAKEIDRDLPVIMITAYAAVHGAVEAMRAGAHDYLAKPFDHNEVIRVVRRALSERELKQRLKELSSQIQDGAPLREMMGPSAAVGRLSYEVNRVAKSNFAVVVVGETGSGKELVARAIHHCSPRSGGPFVPVDCGAIPETLLESELFGHEKGAFTGASVQKRGKFEMAQGGTLFLDEISNMPLGSQAKLLRVLQEKKVYHVGGTKPVEVDVRLVVATNQDLHTLTLCGSFRRDLFFRLNEFTITVPPLRERKEDVPYLARRFLDTTNMELGKNLKGFLDSAMEALIAHDWPGNVRQLRSTIRRAVLLSDGIITEQHLGLERRPEHGLLMSPKVQGFSWNGLSLREVVLRSRIAVEREILLQALRATGGNKAKAARLLKVDYKTIHTKVKKYGIEMEGPEDGQKRG